MLKVFKTFVATVALSQKIILLLDEVPSLQLSPSLSHWNIGKLGEEESCSGLRVVGGITNRFFPSFFSLFLFLQSRHVFQIKEGGVGKKQMYLSRAAPRAEDEGTLPVLSSSHVPTIVSPTTPSHSSLTFLGNPAELKIPGKPLLSCEFLMVGIENNFPSASELSQRGPRPSLFTRIAR